jgi:hypothetical protein
VTLPLHPCPHGCGARLGISSRTADGERGRCGECRGETEYQGGELRVREGDDLAATLRRIVEAIQEFSNALRGLTVALREIGTAPPAPGGRPRQPLTLRAALTHNAQRPRHATDRRPARTPATRRR